SFEGVRTVEGVLCKSFREASMFLHLIKDDQEWIESFTKAIQFASNNSQQSMFVLALLF
ncbi:MAG: hypothetical protein EXX96DRAFT_455649, partial [Benjaminiella poitrasii]